MSEDFIGDYFIFYGSGGRSAQSFFSRKDFLFLKLKIFMLNSAEHEI